MPNLADVCAAKRCKTPRVSHYLRRDDGGNLVGLAPGDRVCRRKRHTDTRIDPWGCQNPLLGFRRSEERSSEWRRVDASGHLRTPKILKNPKPQNVSWGWQIEQLLLQNLNRNLEGVWETLRSKTPPKTCKNSCYICACLCHCGPPQKPQKPSDRFWWKRTTSHYNCSTSFFHVLQFWKESSKIFGGPLKNPQNPQKSIWPKSQNPENRPSAKNPKIPLTSKIENTTLQKWCNKFCSCFETSWSKSQGPLEVR